MNVTVENLPNCIATLRVELPSDKVSKELSSITAEYTRHAKLPGYRPGKAPAKIVEKKFQKEIREELTNRLLSSSCREIVKEKGIRLINLSNVEDLEIAADNTMRYTATLLVEPEFETPEYKSIPVSVKSEEVTEADVDASIEALRSQAADFADLPDKEVALEDFVVIDFTGEIDGKPVHEVFPKAGKPLSGNKDFWIKITPEAFFPGFCDHLIGAKAGDERAFEITVPADFQVQEMAGQKIQYKVTVKAVKEKKLPELDEEFIAKVAPVKTLPEFRDLVKKELARQRTNENQQAKQNQIMAYLVSKVECELPENLVRSETKRILQEIVNENQTRGVADEVLKENEKELVGVAGQNARERLKGNFILGRIAELENITVTQDDLKSRLFQMAMRYQMTMDKLIKEVQKNNLTEQIREEILIGKVLDFLCSSASVQTAEQPA